MRLQDKHLAGIAAAWLISNMILVVAYRVLNEDYETYLGRYGVPVWVRAYVSFVGFSCWLIARQIRTEDTRMQQAASMLKGGGLVLGVLSLLTVFLL